MSDEHASLKQDEGTTPEGSLSLPSGWPLNIVLFMMLMWGEKTPVSTCIDFGLVVFFRLNRPVPATITERR